MTATAIALLLSPAYGAQHRPAMRSPDIVYVALGDSITWGLAASKACRPQVPLPAQSACPDATSFPAVVARALSRENRQVKVQNLAISGARISWILTFELSKIASTVTLFTIFIGTNDFSDIAFHGSGSLDQFARQYVGLIDYLKKHFPKARIVVLNVPNIGYLPCCTAMRAAAATTWTAGDRFIDALAGTATVVDLACDTALYDAALFPASDGVHPSDAGHARIANDILAALVSSRKPAASCPPYF